MPSRPDFRPRWRTGRSWHDDGVDERVLPEPPAQHEILIAAALIRRGAEIALVRQQGPDDPEPIWTLPGGIVGPGELLTEALRREVQARTGLHVVEIGRPAFVTQLHQPTTGNSVSGDAAPSDDRATMFVFEVVRWEGEASARDTRFFAMTQALEILEQLPRLSMREPIAAYLQGEVEVGGMWTYRRDSGGHDVLLDRVPAAPAHSPASTTARTQPSDRPFELSMLTLGCMGIIFLLAIVIVVGLVAVSH